MSVKAMSWAFDYRGLSASEKLVLLSLANFSNDQSQCWPSQGKIATDTELSEKTVWTALKSLEVKGAVKRQGRKRPDGTRTTDMFTLSMPVDKPVVNSTGRPRNPDAIQSQSLRKPPVTITEQNLSLTIIEPSAQAREPNGKGSPGALDEGTRAEREASAKLFAKLAADLGREKRPPMTRRIA